NRSVRATSSTCAIASRPLAAPRQPGNGCKLPSSPNSSGSTQPATHGSVHTPCAASGALCGRRPACSSAFKYQNLSAKSASLNVSTDEIHEGGTGDRKTRPQSVRSVLV